MFENRVDFWMEQKGLKNKHLAKLCNVSEQTFSKWRQNKTQPNLEQAAIIARELNILVDELIKIKDK
ncbi:XRE family transcriptional regulator [Peribacillus saganii]|uniref:XRE family transcriptional regulator n=1 Tax=Peribacillus saganii TaxID=2303992 RepID=A0A372LRE5_9BACI|nr:helix-turn-helix transcriptional regulator [Peribacillus saganii]RFU70352.1 XRE family transcriptional regulator [Peribacillus saganii]